MVNAPAKNDSSQYQQGIQQPTLPTPAGPASNVNIPTSSSLCCVNVRAPVLLQTAWTTAYKLGNPDKNKEVRIIFDTGSQRSYITEAVKRLKSCKHGNYDNQDLWSGESRSASMQSLGVRELCWNNFEHND